MPGAVSDYLIVIGDKEPLAWVLSTGQMAFSASRAKGATRLRKGDTAFVYATSGCFRDSKRDRGRVIAVANIASEVAAMSEPVTFGDQAFTAACDLRIEKLTRLGTGVELGPLARDLHVFDISESWAAYLRRPLVPLDEHDATLLRQRLDQTATTPAHVLPEYVRVARLPGSALA